MERHLSFAQWQESRGIPRWDRQSNHILYLIKTLRPAIQRITDTYIKVSIDFVNYFTPIANEISKSMDDFKTKINREMQLMGFSEKFKAEYIYGSKIVPRKNPIEFNTSF